MRIIQHANVLEQLYGELNHRRYVHPDPLEFLYDYDDPADQEIVALVASSLAYGRVAQILRSVSAVLAKLGPRPARRLAEMTSSRLRQGLTGFKHRFSTGEHVAALLIGAKRIIARFGSLEACFIEGMHSDDTTLLPTLRVFAGRIIEAAEVQN